MCHSFAERKEEDGGGRLWTSPAGIFGIIRWQLVVGSCHSSCPSLICVELLRHSSISLNETTLKRNGGKDPSFLLLSFLPPCSCLHMYGPFFSVSFLWTKRNEQRWSTNERNECWYLLGYRRMLYITCLFSRPWWMVMERERLHKSFLSRL